MDVAALQVKLETTEATNAARQYNDQLKQIGITLVNIDATANAVMRNLAASFSQPTSPLQALNALMQTNITTLQQLQRQGNTTAQTLGTSGSGGAGVTGAATSAGGAINILNNRVLTLVGGFLTLNAAVRGGEALIDARISWESLDLGLKAVTGSAKAAAESEKYLTQTSNDMGLNIQQVIPEFVKINAAMLQSGFNGAQARQVFEDISVVTKTLGFSTATTNRILYDFQEMASLGTVQLRQLRQIIMQVPGGLEIAARAMGVTSQQFHEMVHEGKIFADEFIPKFTAELRNTFGSSMTEAADNMDSAVNRLKNSWFALKVSIAEGSVGNAIKNNLEGAAALLNRITVVHEGLGLFEQIGGDKSTTQQRIDALHNRFPLAPMPRTETKRKPWTITGKEEVIDKEFFVGQYGAMSQLQMDQERLNELWSKKHPVLGPPAPFEEKPPSEKQIEALQKLHDLQEKVHLENLTGLEKEEAQIDINETKQFEALKKLMDLFDPVRDKAKLDEFAPMFGIISGGAEAARGRARYRDQNAFDAKEATEATQAFQEFAGIQERLAQSASGDRYQQGLARINAEYSKMKDTLIGLSHIPGFNVPDSTFGQLEKAKAQDILNLKPKQYFDFAGTSSGDLRNMSNAQRDSNFSFPIVDEETERRFQLGSDKLQQIHNEMIRRMKANSLDLKESMIAGYNEVADSWGTTSERMANMGGTVANSLSTNLTGGLTNVIFTSKDVGQAFNAMTQTILMDLVRIGIQELFVKNLLRGLGGLFGGGAGAGLSEGGGLPLGDTYYGVGHAGGIAGGSLPSRRVPRFHTGGVVGDEVPIMARKGEGIFTPEQMKALGSMIGGNQAQKVEVINVWDERMVDERLIQNPRAILNVLAANSSEVRKYIGSS